MFRNFPNKVFVSNTISILVYQHCCIDSKTFWPKQLNIFLLLTRIRRTHIFYQYADTQSCFQGITLVAFREQGWFHRVEETKNLDFRQLNVLYE